MTNIMKLGKNFIESHSAYEADRWFNVMLGRNGRIHTNNVLLKDNRLHSYINNESMGALDNYARHYKLNIYIKPLENDIYDDIGITVFKAGQNDAVTKFPIKIKDGSESFRGFLKELYTRIDNAVNPRKINSEPVKAKRTEFNNLKLYIRSIKDRYHDWKMEKIRNYVKKHEDDSANSAGKIISDSLEILHFKEIHNV